jgi:hypothetical protein
MVHYDLMLLIAGPIRRNLSAVSEKQAFDVVEDVLDELEAAGLRIEERPFAAPKRGG